MTDVIEKAKGSFIKQEPVLAAHAGAAVVGYAVTALGLHGVQASTVTEQAVPAVTAVLLVALGWLVRRVVSPAAAVAERVEAEVQKRIATYSSAPLIDAPKLLESLDADGILSKAEAVFKDVVHLPAHAAPAPLVQGTLAPPQTPAIPAATEPAPAVTIEPSA